MVIRPLFFFSLAVIFFSGEIQASRVSIPAHSPSLESAQTKNSLEHSTNCQAIISHFEKIYNIPEKLLASIATVESKNCPWAVNALRKSKFFPTKDAAVQYIQKLKAQGVKNINIGCMQINWQSHGRRFNSVGDILTPYQNIAYAAKLMKILYTQHGSWEKAVRYYHSSSSIYNIAYQNRVYSVWAKKKGEVYSPQTISWDSKPSEPARMVDNKKPFIRIAFGPGAGVSKKFKHAK